ncbi:site-specific integrase [Nocardia sp. NPDC004278]
MFQTDCRAEPGVAVADIDPSMVRGRPSCRRAPELFEHHPGDCDRGSFALHQLRRSKLTHTTEDVHADADAREGHISVRSLGKYSCPCAEALIRWQAQTDPAARHRR